MKNQKIDREATVITFASGKGGVGKTALGLAHATVLAAMDKKVLFIDFDLATHGASYFFTKGIKGRKTAGIIEATNRLPTDTTLPKMQKSLKLMGISNLVSYLKTQYNFDFIPSKTSFAKSTYSWLRAHEPQTIPVLHAILSSSRSDYDYIIIDTQAGSTISASEAARVSDKVIIVSEPDPISYSATRNLESEFETILPQNTFYVLNSMWFKDAKMYPAVREYLKWTFSFLPPIPFDFEVRRSFARRTVPVDFQEPSVFVLAIVQMIADLLPELKDEIKNFQQGKFFEPIEDKVHALNEDVDRLVFTLGRDIKRTEKLIRSARKVMLRMVLLSLGLLALYEIVFHPFTTYPITVTLFILLGVVSAVVAYFLSRYRAMAEWKERLSLQEAEYHEQLEKLQMQRKGFETLLATRHEKLSRAEIGRPDTETEHR